MRPDQRRARRRRARRLDSASTRSSLAGDVPTVRNPIGCLGNTAALRPRAADDSTSTAPNIRAWLGRRMMSTPTTRPASASRRSSSISLFGEDLPDDLIGQVGFGELAYRLITLAPPTPQQSRCSRRCWSRWPTTDSPRPPSRPGSPISVRPTRSRVRSPQACSAAARASSVSARTPARSSPRPSPPSTPCRPTMRDGTTSPAPRRARRASGRFVPGFGHHLHKQGDPRTPV